MTSTILKTAFAALLMAFIVHQFGERIYLNLRPADPILPGWEDYDAAKFTERANKGEPVLVEIYASWCPTCKAQHAAFEQLIEEGRQWPIRALRVDFDRDTDFLKAHGLTYTGLLMIFEGHKEVARQAGLTDPQQIEQFLRAHGFAARTE